MENNVLVVLMVAFGLMAIVMFVVFYIYLKKYYNSKHLSDDYQKELDNEHLEEEYYKEEEKEEPQLQKVSFEEEHSNIEPIPLTHESSVEEQNDMEMDFVPIKKK